MNNSGAVLLKPHIAFLPVGYHSGSLEKESAMGTTVKHNPAGRNSKGEEWETQRQPQRMETAAHSSVSSQLDMCDCLLYVCCGNPTCQLHWSVVGRGRQEVGRPKSGKEKKRIRRTSGYWGPQGRWLGISFDYITLQGFNNNSFIPDSHFPILWLLSLASLACVNTVNPTKSSALLLIWCLNLTHCIKLTCMYPNVCARMCVNGELCVISWKEEKRWTEEGVEEEDSETLGKS